MQRDTRDAGAVLTDTAREQGWSEAACLDLCLGFIQQDQRRLKRFENFLRRHAAFENEEAADA